MATKKSWSDLGPRQQQAIAVAAAVELVVTTIAVVDLARRPGYRVRGPKWAWLAVFPVQPIGPIAYLMLGRRR